MKPTLASRRARVARIQAKHPATIDVELEWNETIDPRRLRRVASLLADILDTAGTPGDARKP